MATGHGNSGNAALKLELALQPARPEQPWHAQLRLPDGRCVEFDSIAALAGFLVRLSLSDPPEPGIR